MSETTHRKIRAVLDGKVCDGGTGAGEGSRARGMCDGVDKCDACRKTPGSTPWRPPARQSWECLRERRWEARTATCMQCGGEPNTSSPRAVTTGGNDAWADGALPVSPQQSTSPRRWTWQTEEGSRAGGQGGWVGGWEVGRRSQRTGPDCDQSRDPGWRQSDLFISCASRNQLHICH
jgi:hypothetical protein